jgi:dipeptidyl aminopeptidase/acylaminoacyl peptidase
VRRGLLFLTAAVTIVVAGLAAAVDRPAEAAFPGLNGKIAFTRNPDTQLGLPNDVLAMNLDGSGQTNLTNHPVDDDYPAWSPDGTRIAFTSFRGVSPPPFPPSNYDIFVMNADGSSLTNLTNNRNWDLQPSWSPDGTRIAFATFRGDPPGNYEVFVMNADGSGQTNLTNNAATDYEPAWSPDGTRIAFRTQRDGNDEIYVMDVDGSNPTNLTKNASGDFQPAWSPDGTKIAFSANRGGMNFSEIFVMNADGSGQTDLSNDPKNDSEPTWSPDGTKIAYSTFAVPNGDNEIYVMNADGSGQTNLTNNPADDEEPDWGAVPPPQPPQPPPPQPPPPQPPPAPPPPSPPPVHAPTQARCVVPNVKRKTVAQARRLLASKRCGLGRVRRAYSAKVKTGLVISQTRRPGARLPPGSRVGVLVSRGRRR